MEKLDLAKKYKSYYSAKQQPEVVQIEKATFLSIQGKGDPSGEAFQSSLELLYSVAYAIKFDAKSAGRDFTVPKLEGLWWFDENKYTGLSMDDTPEKVARSEWEYRLLLRMPEFISKKEVDKGIKTVITKKGLNALPGVELFEMTEGKCVQMLHVGSFASEPETLRVMLKFITAAGFKKNGIHHEIYLSDHRKTAPEKLRTILREPIK